MSNFNPDSPAGAASTLGLRVRALRKSQGNTLAEVAAATGLSISALSKIENDQVSPTFHNMMRLAEGLNIPLGDLVTLDSDMPQDAGDSARMSVTRAGEVAFRSTPKYDIGALAPDLHNKRMTPLIERVRHTVADSGDGLISHGGEEFLYVLSGTIEVHMQDHEPVRLAAGDSVYLDSSLAHTYVAVDGEEADVLMVWLSPQAHTGDERLKMAERILSRRAAE